MNMMTRPEFSAQLCNHCGIEHYEGSQFALEIDGEVCTMCCPACNSVAQMLQDIYSQANAEKKNAFTDKRRQA